MLHSLHPGNAPCTPGRLHGFIGSGQQAPGFGAGLTWAENQICYSSRFAARVEASEHKHAELHSIPEPKTPADILSLRQDFIQAKVLRGGVDKIRRFPKKPSQTLKKVRARSGDIGFED